MPMPQTAKWTDRKRRKIMKQADTHPNEGLEVEPLSKEPEIVSKQTQDVFPFLDLAAELRNRIYEEMLENSEETRIYNFGGDCSIALQKWMSQPMLQVCRQIRDEFEFVLYSSITFYFPSPKYVNHFVDNIGTRGQLLVKRLIIADLMTDCSAPSHSEILDLSKLQKALAALKNLDHLIVQLSHSTITLRPRLTLAQRFAGMGPAVATSDTICNLPLLQHLSKTQLPAIKAVTVRLAHTLDPEVNSFSGVACWLGKELGIVSETHKENLEQAGASKIHDSDSGSGEAEGAA